MRLALTRRADYAIRAMLLLSDGPGEVLSGAQIAQQTGIPIRLVTQVMGKLVHAGLVHARLGRHGGYWLEHEGLGTSILAIVEALEGDARRARCVLSGDRCDARQQCRVHDIFAAAQEALISRLATAGLASARPSAGPAGSEAAAV